MKKLVYVTSNYKKFETLQNYIQRKGLNISLEQREFDFQEIQAKDSVDIVYDKIAQVKDIISIPFLVDDTSFSTAKYDGFPGVYTKYINKKLGLEGWKKLFEEGDEISAVTVLGLYMYGDIYKFEGKLNGHVQFGTTSSFSKVNPLNDIIVPTGESQVLTDCLRMDNFSDHRVKALEEIIDFIADVENAYRKSRNSTRKKWNERAETWEDCLVDENHFVNYEDGYERFLKFTENIVSKKRIESVLDVGCGTGTVAEFISRISNPKSILGVDVSEKMILEAKELYGGKIEFIAKDIFDLEDKKYDLITSRGILISDLPKTHTFDFFEKINNLLNEGGIFIFDYLQNINGSNELNSSQSKKSVFNLDQMISLANELNLQIIDFDVREGLSRVGVVAVTKI